MSNSMEVTVAARPATKADNLLHTRSNAHSTFQSIDKLETLSASELRSCWNELFGRRPPPRLGPDLLRRAIGNRLQELSNGGLSRQMQLHLKNAGITTPRPSDLRTPLRIIKPGTRFVREWEGEIHDVRADSTGAFTYRGASYASLTVIANKITGTHQSGPRFFGLKRSTEPRAKEQANG